MATFHLALGFLFLVFLATPSFAQDEYYYLSLLWPGAYCAQSKCCLPITGSPDIKPKADFYVQSLETWSVFFQQALTKCNSSENFSNKDIEALKPEIYYYWSNIRCPSNNGKTYWRNAWKTDGVCSDLSFKDYFSTALQLRSQVDVLGNLAKKGIKPTLEGIYGVSDIKNAIKEGIGAEPLIQCSREKKHGTDYFQLYLVHICVAKDGKTIIECPYNPGYTCPDEIFFLPFDTNDLNNTASAPPSSFIAIE